MIEVVIKLFFVQLILNRIVFAIKAEIENYPNVTLSGCGIGRKSQLIDDSCFKWHNSRDVSQAFLKNGRDVENGEMPFTVYLEIYSKHEAEDGYRKARCTGSIINHDWVITAAHCLVPNPNMTITMVYVYYGLRNMKDKPKNPNVIKFKKLYPHPKYDDNDLEMANDIGLIELKKSIPINSEHPGEFTNLNSVCLPQSGISYEGTGNEYAQYSGWGLLDENVLNDNDPLQLGWGQISNQSTRTDIRIDHIENQPTICTGDSGGPLVQYVKGRAVLIGVVSASSQEPETEITDCGNNLTDYNSFENVSQHIDWIITTIKNSTTSRSAFNERAK